MASVSKRAAFVRPNAQRIQSHAGEAPPERLGQPQGEYGTTSRADGGIRPLETLIALVSVAIPTNGPSIAISHLYNVDLGWDRWPYLIPAL